MSFEDEKTVALAALEAAKRAAESGDIDALDTLADCHADLARIAFELDDDSVPRAEQLVARADEVEHWQHAADIRRAILARDPDTIERIKKLGMALYKLCNAYQRKQSFKVALLLATEVVELDRRALALDPSDQALKDNLALSLEDLGDVRKMASIFENGLLDMSVGEGPMEEAIALRRNAVADDPTHVDARINLAHALIDLSTWRSDREMFGEALKIVDALHKEGALDEKDNTWPMHMRSQLAHW